MLVLRMKWPTRVMRGSSFILNTGPSISLSCSRSLSLLSAFGHMERNLYSRNSLPLQPTRSWLNTGLAPGLSIQTAMQVRSISGESAISASREKKISCARRTHQ